MVTRADELAVKIREGQRAQRELERLSQLPDLGEMENGSIIAASIRFNRGGPAYNYVGYKQEDRWYFTGKNSPQGVTSDEAAAWLAKSGRRVLNLVRVGLYDAELVEMPVVPLGDLLGKIMEFGRSMEYPDGVPMPGGPFGNGR